MTDGPARDSLFRGPQPLAEGERLVETFRADRSVYWRNTLILVVVFGTLAGAALLALGNPYPWIGPVAAVLALGLRSAWLASEALAAEWRLTDRRLLGPAGQAIPLGDIADVKPVFGDLVVITRSGEKFLMKYLRDGAATRARIEAARGGRA